MAMPLQQIRKLLSFLLLTFVLLLSSNDHVVVSLAVASSTTSHQVDHYPRFFIGGLGYCGYRLASRLRKEFPSCAIVGTVRSKSRQKDMKDKALQDFDGRVRVFDLDENYCGLASADDQEVGHDRDGLEDLMQATHIIQTIAPIADFDRDPLLALHTSILEDSDCLQWVGYLSSTGVYGDYSGEWVDENSELRCQDAKSLARVQAEEEWKEIGETRHSRDNGSNTKIDCFRCGGIYGPGRGPLFSAGAPLSSFPPPSSDPPTNSEETPKYVNRILVDDICGAIVAAVKANMDNSKSSASRGNVYNLVDDDPAPRRDVVEEARKLLLSNDNASEEEINTSSDSSVDEPAAPRRSRRRPSTRFTGNKRCRNELLKNDYPEWNQIAPTYREGLAYLWKQQKQ